MPGKLVNDGWDAKYVPEAVKNYIATQAVVVVNQYQTTLLNLAGDNGAQGDGMLNYLGAFHKRFSGSWCILYLWKPRKDGKGTYLAVTGLGRKNGTGNDYSQVI